MRGRGRDGRGRTEGVRLSWLQVTCVYISVYVSLVVVEGEGEEEGSKVRQFFFCWGMGTVTCVAAKWGERQQQWPDHVVIDCTSIAWFCQHCIVPPSCRQWQETHMHECLGCNAHLGPRAEKGWVWTGGMFFSVRVLAHV